MDCVFCMRRSDPALAAHRQVWEFEKSILWVADHQAFPGYCVLALKDHVKEMHDLSLEDQHKVLREMMLVGRTLENLFSADKINYASYGNMVPHLHWHIFPRKIGDLAWPSPPWVKMSEFNQYPHTPESLENLKEMIRSFLSQTELEN